MKLTSVFKLNNRKFEAVSTRPQKELAGLSAVHSLLHMDSRYRFVSPGSIVVDERGTRLLLAQHHSLTGFVVFNAIRITGTASLATTTTEIHPVTKLETGRKVNPAIEVDVVYNRLSDKDDKGLDFERSRYYLGQEVSVNDKIDGQSITDVKYVLGIYIAEVS